MAAREQCGRFLARHVPIPPEAYEGRVVSTLPAPAPDGPVGDLTSPEAAACGVTAEIHATSNYWMTTAWAAAARRDGYGALHYQARFTPGGETALALFGPSGPHPDRPVASTRPLIDVLIDLGYDTDRSTLPSTPAMRARADDTAEPEDADVNADGT